MEVEVEEDAEPVYDSFADRHAILVVLIPVGIVVVIWILAAFLILITPMPID